MLLFLIEKELWLEILSKELKSEYEYNWLIKSIDLIKDLVTF